ncbi:MAG: triose-phosphate isomerase [Candidatus Nealsonbacteria bacterium]|nr:triose-phosphate isomerase [Candidatus Nealsonbacteria bacterium]
MKPLIVANWKCNPASLKEGREILNVIAKDIESQQNVEAVICPPFVYLDILKMEYGGLVFGSQDCFWEDGGPYTGEISPSMLKKLGVEYVIVGHSERRKYHKETDEIIAKKVKAALDVGLKPILCVDRISQIPEDSQHLIIAFEPLSAVGTGRPYEVHEAAKMYSSIRQISGEETVILYGGSVNPINASSYIKEAGFQGLLVGGASLRPKEFIDIVKAACYSE